MKIFRNITVFFAIFFVTAGPVYAQFTVLPEADSKVDCNNLLQKYEINGLIPTVADVAVNKLDKALAESDTYNNMPEQSLCSDPAYSNDPNCLKVVANQQTINNAQKDANGSNKDAQARGDLLGCAIKTGRVSLQMVPLFITYIANFILSMIALVCVLFIVIGGYQYILGGLIDQKEKGKKTIEHALMGLAVATLSWIIVSVIMTVVTS